LVFLIHTELRCTVNHTSDWHFLFTWEGKSQPLPYQQIHTSRWQDCNEVSRPAIYTFHFTCSATLLNTFCRHFNTYFRVYKWHCSLYTLQPQEGAQLFPITSGLGAATCRPSQFSQGLGLAAIGLRPARSVIGDYEMTLVQQQFAPHCTCGVVWVRIILHDHPS
jgi:hypothetical protein